MISIILIGGFLVLLMLGVPVSMSMALPTVICFLLGEYPLQNIPKVLATSVESFPLMAVPFFITAGNIMNATGVTDRIFNFAQSIVGHIKGGLAQVNVLASMIFAGITGAAVADCAGLGTMEMKAMTDRGYEKPFSAAVTIASSTIGPIIPPSVIMILYAIQAQVSIARMFLAGVLPGVLTGIILMIAIYIMVETKKVKCPVEPRQSILQVLRAFKNGVPALLAPVVILFGMVGGFVTPTEAGVLAIFYSVLIGIIFRDLRVRELPAVFVQSAQSTALILFLIAVASTMGWLIAIEGTPTLIANFLLSITTNKTLMLIIINVFLLLLGCVLEGIPALIITVPILLPITNGLGVDPIHFGVIICFNLVLGLATPPMGVSLYILVRIANISFESLVRAIMPLLVPLLVALLLITLFPKLSLFLPNLMMGPG